MESLRDQEMTIMKKISGKFITSGSLDDVILNGYSLVEDMKAFILPNIKVRPKDNHTEITMTFMVNTYKEDIIEVDGGEDLQKVLNYYTKQIKKIKKELKKS